MYFYIYDEFLASPKHQAQLAKIETQLSLMDIKGPAARLHTLTRMEVVVKRAITRGATTLVAVGDDSTLLRVITALPNKKIAVGLITLGKDLQLADLINIKGTKESIEAVVARKILVLNIGKINKASFLQKAHIEMDGFSAVLDNSLTVKTEFPQSIINITNPQLTTDPLAKPQLECELFAAKTVLDTLKWSKERGGSHFKVKKMVLKSQTDISISLDGSKVFKTKNAVITSVANAVRLIIGKQKIREKN